MYGNSTRPSFYVTKIQKNTNEKYTKNSKEIKRQKRLSLFVFLSSPFFTHPRINVCNSQNSHTNRKIPHNPQFIQFFFFFLNILIITQCWNECTFHVIYLCVRSIPSFPIPHTRIIHSNNKNENKWYACDLNEWKEKKEYKTANIENEVEGNCLCRCRLCWMFDDDAASEYSLFSLCFYVIGREW